MKKILLLATGGTIASRPTAAGGLAPAITSEELLACVPELADLCEVSAVQVFNWIRRTSAPRSGRASCAASKKL